MEAFETAYNAACGCIARGELGQAEVLLKRSKGECVLDLHGWTATDMSDLCKSLDDLSESDKEAELLPITVQQIYVLICLGRHDEARQLASSVNAIE